MNLHDFWLFVTGRGIEMAEMEIAAQRFGEDIEAFWKERRRTRTMIFDAELAYITARLDNDNPEDGPFERGSV